MYTWLEHVHSCQKAPPLIGSLHASGICIQALEWVCVHTKVTIRAQKALPLIAQSFRSQHKHTFIDLNMYICTHTYTCTQNNYSCENQSHTERDSFFLNTAYAYMNSNTYAHSCQKLHDSGLWIRQLMNQNAARGIPRRALNSLRRIRS